MMFGNKKGIELTLQTVVIFIIVVVVMIVVILFFADKFGSTGSGLIEFGNNASAGEFNN